MNLDHLAPSEEVIAYELQLHERHCSAEPVVRGPWVRRCPCRQTTVLTCSKCGNVQRALVRGYGVYCSHLQRLLGRYLVDGDLDFDCWIEIRPEPA